MSVTMSLQPRGHSAFGNSPFLAAAAAVMLVAGELHAGASVDAPDGSGIVHAVESAPVAPDGNVAGRATDLVLTLDVPLDPHESGYTLNQGDRLKVTLPEAFEKREQLPLLSIFDCIPQYPRCDTVVPLLGWPQGALGAPPPAGYELSYEGSHTLVITATETLPADPPSSPGLKQIHILLNSFSNPPAGEYRIRVALNAAGSTTEGTGRIRVLPESRPFIAVTNAFHDSFANGNFQRTGPSSQVELPFDLLVWNNRGGPFEGITIEQGRLVRGGEVVGRVSIDAPKGAEGQKVFTRKPSSTTDAPVTRIPAGHLRAFFRAGSETGEYVVTFALNEGNAVRLTARVE